MLRKLTPGIVLVCIAVVGVFLFKMSDESVSEQISSQGETAPASPLVGDEVTTGTAKIDTSPSQEQRENPILSGILKTKSVSSKTTGVDVFVINAQSVVGYDSWNKELLTDSRIDYSEDASNVKRFHIKELDPYDKDFKIYVLGRGNAAYELSGTYRDAEGAVRPFSYNTEIKTGESQVYSFDFKNGTIAEKRDDVYTSFDPFRLFLFPKAEGCDGASLKKQALSRLEQHGFKSSDVRQTGEWLLKMDKDIDGRNLPFGTKSVCTLVLQYENQESADSVFGQDAFSVLGTYAESYKGVAVGGVVFDQNPADGPTGSSNRFPFSAVPDSVQLFHMSRSSEFVGVNFPAFFTCPCSQTFTVALTAPMFVR